VLDALDWRLADTKSWGILLAGTEELEVFRACGFSGVAVDREDMFADCVYN
jgi:hypothetical protein